MSRSFEQEEHIKEMAASLEKQLNFQYPKGPSSFNGIDGVPDLEEETFLRNNFQAMINELPFPSDFDTLKKAFVIAVQQWKAKTNDAVSGGGDQSPAISSTKNAKTTGKSFSLLDQLQGGFALPVPFEEIQEASSSQDRFIVLEKIKYSEDLLMDWDKISPILSNDLSETFITNPDLTFRLISLHRKWFDQGRSSTEYTPLLYGICDNMLETLVTILSSAESQCIDQTEDQRTIVISLVQNWRDMWLDLMQRDQYLEECAEKMEKSMFRLFLRSGSCKTLQLAQKVLALIDPCAYWFQSWVTLIRTNERLISLLCGSENETKILFDTWNRVRSFFENGGSNTNETPFQLYSVAILCTMLCKTRISQFPWDSITSSDCAEDPDTKRGNKNANKIQTAVDEMLDLFLKVFAFISVDGNAHDEHASTNLKRTVLDGIEAILAGSRNNTESVVNRRYEKVKSSLKEQNVARDTTVDYFINVRLHHLRLEI